jgi:hypothetical protein
MYDLLLDCDPHLTHAINRMHENTSAYGVFIYITFDNPHTLQLRLYAKQA